MRSRFAPPARVAAAGPVLCHTLPRAGPRQVVSGRSLGRLGWAGRLQGTVPPHHGLQSPDADGETKEAAGATRPRCPRLQCCPACSGSCSGSPRKTVRVCLVAQHLTSFKGGISTPPGGRRRTARPHAARLPRGETCQAFVHDAASLQPGVASGLCHTKSLTASDCAVCRGVSPGGLDFCPLRREGEAWPSERFVALICSVLAGGGGGGEGTARRRTCSERALSAHSALRLALRSQP